MAEKKTIEVAESLKASINKENKTLAILRGKEIIRVITNIAVPLSDDWHDIEIDGEPWDINVTGIDFTDSEKVTLYSIDERTNFTNTSDFHPIPLTII